ncbi:MAG: hypothetical protein ACREEW_03275 [Caulobacteraceae bacterium]
MAAPNALVVIDGAFLLRPAFRSHWDLAIWLDVSFETVLARAMVRDAAWVGDPERIRERYLTGWIPTHEIHEASGARAAAHVIIDNEAPDRPCVLFQRPVRR